MRLEENQIAEWFFKSDSDSQASWHFIIDRVTEALAQYLSRGYLHKTSKHPFPDDPFWGMEKNGRSVEDISTTLFSKISPLFLNHAHPGFMEASHSSSCIAGQLGTFMAGSVNQVVESHHSPGTMLIAEKLALLLSSMFRFPHTVRYTASMYDSHRHAITTALKCHLKALGHADLEEEGILGRPEAKNSVVLLPQYAHPALLSALQDVGLGSRQIVKLGVDEKGQVDFRALNETAQSLQKAGKFPFCLVANGGNGVTGSIDRLDKLADFCEQHKLWYHIDASYGAAFLMHGESAEKFAGQDRANSISWSPSLRLHVPHPSSLLILKGKKSPEEGHLAESKGFSISRSMDGQLLNHILPLFLVLKHFGESGVDALLDHSLNKANEFANYLKRQSDFALLFEPMLDTVCFRYVSSGKFSREEINHFNEKVPRVLYEKGEYVLSLVTVHKEKYLKANPISPLTTMDHLMALVREIRSLDR